MSWAEEACSLDDDDGLWSVRYLPNHGLEKPGPVSNGGYGLVHQRMHLDEVECVIGELIGYLIPLHRWSTSTVARPTNGVEEEQGNEEER